MIRVFRRLYGLGVRRLIVSVMLVSMLALTLSGCDVDTPQNTFDPKGEVADKQKDVFLAAMWPALIIMIGVLLATVIIVLRFRRRDDDPIPKQTHGNTRLELAWTIAPALLLLGLGIPMVATLWDIGGDPSDDAFQVDVQGVQWQWLFSYPELIDENGQPLGPEIGEVTVPVGREIAINLSSPDVIHSFWLPKIAGKLDAVPGRDNRMWIKVDEPGSYSGQCAEFCGLSHADMTFVVHALSEEDFEAWMAEQGATPARESDGVGGAEQDGNTGE